MDLGETQAALLASEAKRVEQATELTQIRATLSTVAVYEGISDVSPLTMMISDLVRDHTELERRIDAIVMECLDPDLQIHLAPLAEKIAKIARGGGRTPDDLSGMTT